MVVTLLGHGWSLQQTCAGEMVEDDLKMGVDAVEEGVEAIEAGVHSVAAHVCLDPVEAGVGVAHPCGGQ